MNLITSLLGRLGYEKAGRRSYNDGWVSIAGGSDGINERTLLQANKEWTAIAVDKVATAMVGIRFKVMRYARNGDDREVFEGPLADFLESPADTLTGKDFIYLNTVYKELTGNAFWERVQGDKLKPLIPTNMTPVIKAGRIVTFKYSEGGTQRDIAIKDILHDRYVDPAKPWWGRGKLHKISRWVDTSSIVGELLSSFFTNGGIFGGFIETEEESEERIKLIKLGLKNDHVGVANWFKWAVLPKGSKASPQTLNLSDMEMGATDDRYRDKILAAFGVPKTLVGLTTEVNRASAEASEYIFAKYTLKPVADDLIEFLNANVAPTLDKTGTFYFAYDEFIPDNTELRIKERESALNKQPYMTVNEVRASVGLPPVPDGDVIYSSPGTALGQPVITPQPGNDNAEPDADEEPKKALPRRARAAMKLDRLAEHLAEKAGEIVTNRTDPDAESHKAFVGRVEDHEKLVAGKMRDFNNQQERDVVLRLKQITKAVAKSDVLDMDREVSVLVDFVGPMLKGLMLEQAIAEFVDQGYPGTLDQSQPRIKTLVERAARRFAKSYNRTTARLVTDTLNEGISGGEDLTQLTDRVRRVYDYSNQVRAAAVARTESFYIANEGSREAFRQSGVVKTMRWYTADYDACQYCQPMNGKVVGVNEVFFPKGHELTGSDGGKIVLDYRAIDVPPLHTSCRCFIRPDDIDIG